ncbi:hypothetical protein, partial [uncultured Alistipes sp.]
MPEKSSADSSGTDWIEQLAVPETLELKPETFRHVGIAASGLLNLPDLAGRTVSARRHRRQRIAESTRPR